MRLSFSLFRKAAILPARPLNGRRSGSSVRGPSTVRRRSRKGPIVRGARIDVTKSRVWYLHWNWNRRCAIGIEPIVTGGPRPPLPLEGTRFVVVGAGRLGVRLARSLTAEGASLAGYVTRSSAGSMRAQTLLQIAPSGGLDDLVASAPGLYLLTVPDDVLPQVAADLALALARASRADACAKEPKAPFVMHTSGVSSIRVLDPCRQAGAVTLAFHPLQTFSGLEIATRCFEGIAVAVTARTVDAGDFGFLVARALGARPFALADERRVLYHAAACMASNYLVALEACSQRLFVDAGLPPRQALGLFLPLVRTTLDNIAAQGPVDALTGPIARGDLLTVRRHLEELRQTSPDLLPLYRILGLAALELAREAGRVPATVIAQLGLLLGKESQLSHLENDDRGTS